MKPLVTSIAVVLASAAAAEDKLQRIWTDQGWSDIQDEAPEVWYEISQGSRLIRMDWFHALSEAGAPFSGRALAKDYGYPYRLCCTNRLGDSLHESSMIAGSYEQLASHKIQDHELVGLQ